MEWNGRAEEMEGTETRDQRGMHIHVGTPATLLTVGGAQTVSRVTFCRAQAQPSYQYLATTALRFSMHDHRFFFSIFLVPRCY